MQGVLAEFITLGALSGLLAAIGASVAAYYLTTRWLELQYRFALLPWLVGVAGGALLVAARRLARHAPRGQSAAAVDPARLKVRCASAGCRS